MRTLKQFLVSVAALPFVAAGLGPGSSASPAASPVSLASAGGSELPWWTPLGVTLVLLAVAGVYRLRHRRGDSGGDPDAAAPTASESSSVPEPGPAAPPESTDPPRPVLDADVLTPIPVRS